MQMDTQTHIFNHDASTRRQPKAVGSLVWKRIIPLPSLGARSTQPATCQANGQTPFFNRRRPGRQSQQKQSVTIHTPPNRVSQQGSLSRGFGEKKASTGKVEKERGSFCALHAAKYVQKMNFHLRLHNGEQKKTNTNARMPSEHKRPTRTIACSSSLSKRGTLAMCPYQKEKKLRR